MTVQAPRIASMLWLTVLLLGRASAAPELVFEVAKVEPQSRVDAIAYLGDGVVVAGTRGAEHFGYVHVSRDYGVTWRSVGNVTGTDYVTCLASGGGGVAYLLTGGEAHVWKTTDYGETWADLGRVSNAHNGQGYANAYGMVTTRRGSVLVADADGTGGRIHRSTDQGATWQDLGPISTHALYRLIEAGDDVIANGWAGHVYKSSDDGLTWKDMGKVAESALYAIEYLDDDDTIVIGTERGNVYRSKDGGVTWEDAGVVGAAADDFAWMGGSGLLYSTYTEDRSVHLSRDSGATWSNLGPLPTVPDDWLDHVICIRDPDARVVVGGTNKGFIVYSRLPEP